MADRRNLAEKVSKYVTRYVRRSTAFILRAYLTVANRTFLRSIRNGLMNCGRMRCQASDNFTFGSCVDKTIIYTDEMWFTLQNIEEAKCIPEGTETYVNVKHQNERLLKRTPSLNTSNVNPWRHVLGEKKTLENRMYIHCTSDAPVERMGNDRA